MTTHINDSGTWRTLTEVHVNDSGTWRNIQEVYVNDGGTWRSVFLFATVTLNPNYDVVGINSVEITFESDADISSNSDAFGPVDEGDWLSPTSAAPGLFEIRATLTGGVNPTTGTMDTWLALTSNRTWTLDSGGEQLSEFLIEIRYNGGAALDSTTVSLGTTGV